MKQCGGCAFWVEPAAGTKDPWKDNGECHRRAPAPIVALGDVTPYVWWPMTTRRDGCGEWEDKIERDAQGLTRRHWGIIPPDPVKL